MTTYAEQVAHDNARRQMEAQESERRARAQRRQEFIDEARRKKTLADTVSAPLSAKPSGTARVIAKRLRAQHDEIERVRELGKTEDGRAELAEEQRLHEEADAAAKAALRDAAIADAEPKAKDPRTSAEKLAGLPYHDTRPPLNADREFSPFSKSAERAGFQHRPPLLRGPSEDREAEIAPMPGSYTDW